MPANPSITVSCECPEAGYCPRHGCHKTEHWHQLCRKRSDYFQLWEAGRGPGPMGCLRVGLRDPLQAITQIRQLIAARLLIPFSIDSRV